MSLSITKRGAASFASLGIANRQNGLTICLIGNNTITAENGVGILNGKDCSLTITGSGSLTVKGPIYASSVFDQGIYNAGTITVRNCTITASGGYGGLYSGYWTFDNCTVHAIGGILQNSETSSFGELYSEPVFHGCSITSPEGARWEIILQNGNVRYTLFGADSHCVIDTVTIEPITYDVVLEVPGSNNYLVAMKIRDIMGIDLVDAKRILERAPIFILMNVSLNDAQWAVETLRATGSGANYYPHDTMNPDGIHTPQSERSDGDEATFNLSGQRVNRDYRGITVRQGKKVLKR